MTKEEKEKTIQELTELVLELADRVEKLEGISKKIPAYYDAALKVGAVGKASYHVVIPKELITQWGIGTGDMLKVRFFRSTEG